MNAPQTMAPKHPMGLPASCGKPLCSEGDHHPLCGLAPVAQPYPVPTGLDGVLAAAQALLHEHEEACATDPMFALLEMAKDDEEVNVSSVLLLDLFRAVRALGVQPAVSTVELSDDRMPQALQTDAIVEMNVAMLRQRSALGIEKYGTTLADSKLPLNAWLQHALEETLDNANYLQAAIQSNASRLTAGMAHSVDVAAQNAAQRLGRALLAKQAAQSPVVGRDAVDAARYRWLEQQHEGGDDSFCVFRPSGNRLVPIGSMTGELATAIDAAINSKEG